MNAIIITLLSGLSFLVGYLITKFVKNQKKLVIFSVGFSFIIIIGLVLFDLLPECLEVMKPKWAIIGYAVAGLLILKALDFFVPDHEHSSNHEHHMEHIGLISTIALVLHNLIEGTAIYSTALTDTKMGLMMALAVSFHNIPLGIQVSSLVKNKKEKLILLSSLVLSSIVGIALINLFNVTISDNVLGVLMSITLGMLIYIAFFELLCEIKEHFKDKTLWLGVIVGAILVIVGILL
jgi:ZIP family zinc transporter